jgi:hypothetical protein
MKGALNPERVKAFTDAFDGPLDSLAALYRKAAADALRILTDASSTLAARQRAKALLRQYQVILANLRDESALWIETNLPKAYGLGLSFADEGVANIRRAGINLGTPQRAAFAQVHREAVAAAVQEMLRTADFALAQIGRRAGDTFRKVGVEEVARGVAEGLSRVDVSRNIKARLLAEGKHYFTDRRGRKWDLDRYTEMVARTTTREATVQGSVNRMLEHNVQLARIVPHPAIDFCLPFQGKVFYIGPEPNPTQYPGISAMPGGKLPPWHPQCKDSIAPFVLALATKKEMTAGEIDPTWLGRTPAELERQLRRSRP